MSNRFNTLHDKPARLNLASKQRVMQEFKNIQESMAEIKQSMIEAASEPELPDQLKAYAVATEAS